MWYRVALSSIGDAVLVTDRNHPRLMVKLEHAVICLRKWKVTMAGLSLRNVNVQLL